MGLDWKPILHILNTHTLFQNALPIRTKSTEHVCYAFVEGLASLNIGYPNVIRLDHESTCKSDYFRNYAYANVIQFLFSVIDSHNSIGTGELYHSLLCPLFRFL